MVEILNLPVCIACARVRHLASVDEHRERRLETFLSSRLTSIQHHAMTKADICIKEKTIQGVAEVLERFCEAISQEPLGL
jgi:hypothetical protein